MPPPPASSRGSFPCPSLPALVAPPPRSTASHPQVEAAAASPAGGASRASAAGQSSGTSPSGGARRGPLSRAGPRLAALPFERVRADHEAEKEAASDDPRDADEREEAEEAAARDEAASLEPLAADRDDTTLAVSSLSARAARSSLPLAAPFLVTLLAAARSTISHMDDSLMSATHGCGLRTCEDVAGNNACLRDSEPISPDAVSSLWDRARQHPGSRRDRSTFALCATLSG